MKSFYGRNKADAERKYAQYIESRGRDAPAKPQNDAGRLFRTMAGDYISNVLKPSQKYALATKDRYTMAYDTHIRGTWLDRMRVTDIRAADIQRFYNEIPVSKQTLASVNKFMRGFCRWLVLNEYASDFLTAVDIPIKPENKRHEGIQTWSENEIHAILKNIKGHRLCCFVYMMFFTGTRISEAIALKHSDIRSGIVHITRQCYNGEVKPPKYNSVREVPMHEELSEVYQKHIIWQAKEMETNRYRTDLLFTTSNGTMYDPVDIRRSLKRFYDSYGIPNKSPHTYRATFCTQMCRNGVPIEVASNLLGHKSIEVTAKYYTRIEDDSRFDAMSRFSY